MKQTLDLSFLKHEIRGFCLPFAQLLLAKLLELKAQDRIFIDGLKEVEKRDKIDPEFTHYLTPIACSVIEHLCDQIKGEPQSSSMSIKQVDGLIATFEEFLAIFNKAPQKRSKHKAE